MNYIPVKWNEDYEFFFFNRKEGRKDKEKGNREREGGMEGGKQKG